MRIIKVFTSLRYSVIYPESYSKWNFHLLQNFLLIHLYATTQNTWKNKTFTKDSRTTISRKYHSHKFNEQFYFCQFRQSFQSEWLLSLETKCQHDHILLQRFVFRPHQLPTYHAVIHITFLSTVHLSFETTYLFQMGVSILLKRIEDIFICRATMWNGWRCLGYCCDGLQYISYDGFQFFIQKRVIIIIEK